MKQVSTSIEIAAPTNQVWRVLTDFEAYPQWNPFMRSVSGRLEAGEQLTVHINPPGGKGMTFKPTVLIVEEGRRFRWRGRLLLPGVFDGEHSFELSNTPRGTRLKHGEKFSGLLVGMVMGSASLKRTERGFVEMNEALKLRAEALD